MQYYQKKYRWSKIIIRTTFIVGELMSQLHTHQLHNFHLFEEFIYVMRVYLVSACLASMISQKGNYTTDMLGELISNGLRRQLHINSCWGISFIIIPAPMVSSDNHLQQEASEKAPRPMKIKSALPPPPKPKIHPPPPKKKRGMLLTWRFPA